jgi:hypothetical protein
LAAVARTKKSGLMDDHQAAFCIAFAFRLNRGIVDTACSK